eukprot:TRINITY_DN1753_c0_g1_i1.p1 TRINITY_DN1753_c0_g1~~TRINITY_DN1753_c0_g1_i1.p1  ORF type:complete len:1089 (+),score=162.40 TRINITY_DN1753_c0_g1_i1:402-3269(+)
MVRGHLTAAGLSRSPIMFTCDPSSASPRGQLVGCAAAATSLNSAASFRLTTNRMTVEACVSFCAERHYAAAFVSRRECSCGDSVQVPGRSCSARCFLENLFWRCYSTTENFASRACRSSSQRCGGDNTFSVYGTGLCQHWKPFQFGPLSTARLQHVAMLNGGGNTLPFQPTLTAGQHVHVQDVLIVRGSGTGLAVTAEKNSSGIHVSHNQGHGVDMFAGGTMTDLHAAFNAWNAVHISPAAVNSTVSLSHAVLVNNSRSSRFPAIRAASTSMFTLKLKDVSIKDHRSRAVEVQGGALHMEDVAIERFGTMAGEFAVSIQQTDARSVLRNVTVRHGRAGIRMNQGHSLTVENCHISDCAGTFGIEIVAAASTLGQVRLQGNALVNNSFDTVINARSAVEPPMSIEQNSITNNTVDQFVMVLTPGDSAQSGINVTNNIFLDNRATRSRSATAAILGFGVNLHSNHFLNPSLESELRAELTCSTSCAESCLSQCTRNISASSNWWGTRNAALIEDRIVDAQDFVQLPFIDSSAMLTSADFDCASVDNCSDHGRCVGNGQCRCDAGYQGESCALISCSNVNDCNAQALAGVCIGPNTCQCSSQWNGTDCTTPVCLQGCGHGTCMAPDMCQCNEGWAGSACDTCASGYAGASCSVLCPVCVNGGQCDVGLSGNGACACPSPFAGVSCDSCVEGLSGPDCQAYTSTSALAPSKGLPAGGETVFIFGYNFNASAVYTSVWGSEDCHGDAPIASCVYINATTLQAVAPAQNPSVSVHVHIYEDGTIVQHGQQLEYTYATLNTSTSSTSSISFMSTTAGTTSSRRFEPETSSPTSSGSSTSVKASASSSASTNAITITNSQQSDRVTTSNLPDPIPSTTTSPTGLNREDASSGSNDTPVAAIVAPIVVLLVLVVVAAAVLYHRRQNKQVGANHMQATDMYVNELYDANTSTPGLVFPNPSISTT